MRQAMLMNNENSVNRPPHSKLLIFISHPLEPRGDRRVLFKERVLGAKGVVGERVEVDRAGDGETRVLGEARLPEHDADDSEGNDDDDNKDKNDNKW